VLGQSFDGFVLIPFSTFEAMYGRRKTTVVSIKMENPDAIEGAMARTEEAMRVAHRLRPGEPDDFTVDKADALVAFWKSLTRVLFTAIPAVVGIGIVVGGIVIMNIMLMVVTERTREIGLRKALGARRSDIMAQILTESVVLSMFGGVIGTIFGAAIATTIAAFTPVPASVETWSVALGIGITAAVGLFFGLYPAMRAARLDPIEALRKE
jgi:putative ABC transport system permease protein